MFRVRQEHVRSLSPVLAGTLPERIQQGLQQKGFTAVHDPASGAVIASDARGLQTRVSFSPTGHPESVTLPSGSRFRFEAANSGRLSAVTFPNSERLELGYDARGNIASITRPGLVSHELSHDAEDRLTRVTYPDGSATSFHYGTVGLERYVDRTGASTIFSRDEAAQKCAITDPLGRTTSFLLDANNKLESIQFPDGSEQRFQRDEDGNARTITRRDGQRVAIENGKQFGSVTLLWPDGNRTDFKVVEGASKLYQLENATGPVTITYDEDGRPRSEHTSDGTTEYVYDREGRLTELRTPFGDAIRYQYDVDGRLAAIRDWEDQAIAFEYNDGGDISAIRYGRRLLETRSYGRLGGVSHVTVTDAHGHTCSEQTYQYDLCERLVGLSDAWGPGPEDIFHRKLVIDAEGRILAEIDHVTERVLAEYDYDAKGNLTHDNGQTVYFGPMDEPLSHRGHAIEYDGCGNMLRFPAYSGEEFLCSFSGDGTLSEIRVEDRQIRFTYDALGRRVSKTVGRATWRYGWAGGHLLWEEWIPYPGAAPIRRDYLYHPDGITPLAFREGGRTYWMQTDCRKAVIRVFDDNGDTVWRAHYDSFGQASIAVSIVRQPLRLAGQYEDEETRLHYNLARYYCPWIKSYLSLDPSWPCLGATNYSYARNNPWALIDPLGAIAFLAVVGVIAVGAALGAIIGGVEAYFGHGDILVGAVTGAIEGAFMAGGFFLTPIGEALCNAAGTVIANVVEQWMTGQEICWKCALGDGLTSLIIDALTFKLSRIPFVRKILDKITSKIDEVLGKVWKRLKGGPNLDPPTKAPDTPTTTPDSPKTKVDDPETKVDASTISKKELNAPKPNSTYTVNGYTYQTDELGRVTSVSGKLQLEDAPRNPYRQRIAGGDDRLPSDQGGHLIASRFAGSGEGINLVAQDANLNNRAWKQMENEWAKLLEGGNEVKVDIRPIYDNVSKRPTSFEVDYSINGVIEKTRTFMNGEL